MYYNRLTTGGTAARLFSSSFGKKPAPMRVEIQCEGAITDIRVFEARISRGDLLHTVRFTVQRPGVVSFDCYATSIAIDMLTGGAALTWTVCSYLVSEVQRGEVSYVVQGSHLADTLLPPNAPPLMLAVPGTAPLVGLSFAVTHAYVAGSFLLDFSPFLYEALLGYTEVWRPGTYPMSEWGLYTGRIDVEPGQWDELHYYLAGVAAFAGGVIVNATLYFQT